MTVLSSTAAGREAELVRAFYEALNTGDGRAIATLVDETFADAAAVEFPPSLPYGGVVEGAKRLRRMFAAMASGQISFGPRQIDVERLIADGDHVVAVLGFDWHPPEGMPPIVSGASELWSFTDGKVVGIRAYYWDTAALVAASP